MQSGAAVKEWQYIIHYGRVRNLLLTCHPKQAFLYMEMGKWCGFDLLRKVYQLPHWNECVQVLGSLCKALSWFPTGEQV